MRGRTRQGYGLYRPQVSRQDAPSQRPGVDGAGTVGTRCATMLQVSITVHTFGITACLRYAVYYGIFTVYGVLRYIYGRLRYIYCIRYIMVYLRYIYGMLRYIYGIFTVWVYYGILLYMYGMLRYIYGIFTVYLQYEVYYGIFTVYYGI